MKRSPDWWSRSRDKMVDILHVISWNAFSWMKIVVFFHYNFSEICSNGPHWQYACIGWGKGLAPIRPQGSGTNNGPIYWLIYMSPGLNYLREKHTEFTKLLSMMWYWTSPQHYYQSIPGKIRVITAYHINTVAADGLVPHIIISPTAVISIMHGRYAKMSAILKKLIAFYWITSIIWPIIRPMYM